MLFRIVVHGSKSQRFVLYGMGLGAADVFLETEREDCCCVQSREMRAGGRAVFYDVDVHETGCGALGGSDQTVSGAVAACQSTVYRRRSQISHTVGDATSRGGAVPVRHAAEAGGRRTWRQHKRGASLDETIPRRRNSGAGAETEGRHAAGRNR